MPLELLKLANVLALGVENPLKGEGAVLYLGDSLGSVNLYAVREVWNAVDRTWRRPSRKPGIVRTGRTIEMLDILGELVLVTGVPMQIDFVNNCVIYGDQRAASRGRLSMTFIGYRITC